MTRHARSLWRLATYENGFPFEPDDFGSTGTAVIRIRQLIDPNAETDLTERRVSSNYLLKDGDLVFSWSGSLAVRTWNRGPGWLNQHLFKVIPSSGVHQGWLRWTIDASIPTFLGMMHGSAMTHLTHDMLKQLKVEVPSLDEQRRIADFLDAETARIDQLVALQHSVLARIGQRDHAVRDSLINGLADKVGELPLRRYSPKIEQGSSPSCESHPRGSDEWGVLKLSAVKQGRFFPDENKQLPSDIAPIRAYEIHDGDLLVTRANTPELVGDVAVVSGASPKLLLPDLIYRVGIDRRINAGFVAQVLLSSRIRSLIQATARGSSQSMVKIRGEDIKEWPVPRANAEQQAEVLSRIERQSRASDQLRATIDRELALLAERRQALITAAVTGEISV